MTATLHGGVSARAGQPALTVFKGNSLDRIERNLIASSIAELCRAIGLYNCFGVVKIR